MSVHDEAKVDCHTHVFDPARFPYSPDTPYRPAGQELAPAHQFMCVMEAYGVHELPAVSLDTVLFREAGGQQYGR